MSNRRRVISSIRRVIVATGDQEVPTIGPDKPTGPNRHLTNTEVNFRPIPPVHGPIVSVVTLHGQLNTLESRPVS